MEFADGYEGVTHAGIAVVARDSGRFLLAKRAFDDSDAPEVAETWEFPGGSLDEGEDAQAGAFREFAEEIGVALPAGEVVTGWRSGDEGHYQGFVYAVETEFETSPDPEEVSETRWCTVEDTEDLDIRPEMADFDWNLLDVSGNEDTMTAAGENMLDDDAVERIGAMTEEPVCDLIDLLYAPILVHGVIAPEDTESGDGRGFTAGAMTTRPLRIPFRFQKSDIGGHDGAITVGSVDRIMRKDNLIHWEGRLMATPEANELLELIEFFGNRYGVSVDGDRGSLDEATSEARGGTWFDAIRAAGLTAVAIPAFAEAYVAIGPHPEMPADDTEEALAASGLAPTDIIGRRTFRRGAGWVTNPKETKRLHSYWTEPGQPGYAKIGWGNPGDWTRCTVLVGEKIAANSPEKMRFIKQICAEWHHDALGYWPGELGKPGNAPDTPENRRRAARHAASSETVEASDGEGDLLSEAHEESAEVNRSAAEAGWEPVLTSSAGVRVVPPASYFDRHPESGALVIEEPDEHGIRRVHGYAGEWGVCHIGFDGRCVEVPSDPSGGDYPEFHLGRTKTDAGYINTGLVTYKVAHRDGQQILSETAEQTHFDNIESAWAAVRLGEDERGVWFSGVVLPHVPEEDLVLIEAAGQVSGEWRYGALRTLLAVNVPGFAVMRASAAFDTDGQIASLVASPVGSNVGDCAPTPAERMAALREAHREAEAENALARFQKLKDQWKGRS